ncbi:transposable element Tc1 transposase [Trichonephila inaurata madagascariensis]|uniref:Transposable element Tc1 transposase n=1 Tax=Trichonephila inaurata madagascariensis TaxID=2747483 RepID=A0A8X7CBU9_9ARAC|nr:transposable element Tc1 transposase [Trichonephila inaurata madagascariensis]
MSKKSYEDRKSRLCVGDAVLFCLKQSHMAKNCHGSVKCLICGRRHYVLLCPELRNPSSSKDKMINGEEHPVEVLLTNLPTEREVYCKTITIRLRHKDMCTSRRQICNKILEMEDAKLNKLKIYRHCRMVFGISSSLFLLNVTVKYHLGQDRFQTETLQIQWIN